MLLLLGGTAESDTAYCDRCYCNVRLHVRLYACLSVTLVHPAKAVGRNDMPFSRDTRVVPGNIVLDRGPGPKRKKEIWGPEIPVRSDAACWRTTLALAIIAKSTDDIFGPGRRVPKSHSVSYLLLLLLLLSVL